MRLSCELKYSLCYQSGFLPRLNAHFGQRYTVAATEALSEFQRLQLNQRAARHQLERVVDLQAGKGQPWDLVDRFVSEDDSRKKERRRKEDVGTKEKKLNGDGWRLVNGIWMEWIVNAIATHPGTIHLIN